MKFVMIDLPLLLNIEWQQILKDIDVLQMLLAIFPVVFIIGFAAALNYSPGNRATQTEISYMLAFFNEAGFHRPQSPLWFALGP